MKLNKIDYHRNGVSGTGFFVLTFTEKRGNKNCNMMAIAFDPDIPGTKGCLAILDVDLLAAGVIEFGENSWRYEHYADFVRGEITKWETEHLHNIPDHNQDTSHVG
jgi:hypothetical protein